MIKEEEAANGLTYLGTPNALVCQMPSHPSDKLNLVLGAQPGDSRLQHIPKIDVVDSNERVIVHVSKEAHDELAVHPIRDAAVAGDRVAKVLDFERAL
jgi:hypothetical protein